MVQANKCGHCSNAKPAFQKFAEKNRDVACLTIQCNMGNSTEEEKKLLNIVLELKPDFQGFPDYMKFVGGKYTHEEISGRDEKALQKFVLNGFAVERSTTTGGVARRASGDLR